MVLKSSGVNHNSVCTLSELKMFSLLVGFHNFLETFRNNFLNVDSTEMRNREKLLMVKQGEYDV